MPLYEYVCNRCSKSFEELVYEGSATPVCPTCAQRDEVARVPFGKVTLGKKENLNPPFIKGVRPRGR